MVLLQKTAPHFPESTAGAAAQKKFGAGRWAKVGPVATFAGAGWMTHELFTSIPEAIGLGKQGHKWHVHG